MRKNAFGVLVVLLGAMLLVSFLIPTCADAAPAAIPETIKIGTAISLTGMFASGALEVKDGYRVGVEMINNAGGVYVKEFGKKLPLELIIRDDESDPAKAVSRMEELYSRHNPVVFLGGYGSNLHAAAASVSERYKVPYLGIAFALYSIHQQGYKYLFSPYVKSPGVAKGMFDGLESELGDRRPRKFAIFEILDDWGKEYCHYWRQEAKKHGLEIVYDASHPISCKDFSSLLLGAQAAGAEFLLCNPNPADTLTMIKQMKELGIYFKGFLANRPPRGDVLFKNVGDAANYLINLPSWSPYLDYPGIEKVIQKLEEYTKIPRDLQIMTGDGVACIQIIANAIERAGTLDRGKIRDAIAATNLMTVAGLVVFGPDGVSRRDFVLTQYQNNKLELILPKHTRAKPMIYPMPPWDKRPK